MAPTLSEDLTEITSFSLFCYNFKNSFFYFLFIKCGFFFPLSLNYRLYSQVRSVFPGGSVVKNLPANSGDVGLIPGSGRSPGKGNDNPLQYSCLGNSMDRGAQRATVHGVTRVQHDLETKQQTAQMRASTSQSNQHVLVIHNIEDGDNGPDIFTELWIIIPYSLSSTFNGSISKPPELNIFKIHLHLSL